VPEHHRGTTIPATSRSAPSRAPLLLFLAFTASRKKQKKINNCTITEVVEDHGRAFFYSNISSKRAFAALYKDFLNLNIWTAVKSFE
jgi:hypothetical protein